MGLLAGPKKGGPITREKKNSLQFSPFPALLPNRFLGELPAQLAPVDGMRPEVPTGPERLRWWMTKAFSDFGSGGWGFESPLGLFF